MALWTTALVSQSTIMEISQKRFHILPWSLDQTLRPTDNEKEDPADWCFPDISSSSEHFCFIAKWKAIGWVVIGFVQTFIVSREDPLTFSMVPSARQSFYLSCEISQGLLGGMAPDLVKTFLVPRWCTLMNLVTFPALPPWGWHSWLWVKCLNIKWTDMTLSTNVNVLLRMNCNKCDHPQTTSSSAITRSSLVY